MSQAIFLGKTAIVASGGQKNPAYLTLATTHGARTAQPVIFHVCQATSTATLELWPRWQNKNKESATHEAVSVQTQEIRGGYHVCGTDVRKSVTTTVWLRETFQSCGALIPLGKPECHAGGWRAEIFWQVSLHGDAREMHSRRKALDKDHIHLWKH